MAGHRVHEGVEEGLFLAAGEQKVVIVDDVVSARNEMTSPVRIIGAMPRSMPFPEGQEEALVALPEFSHQTRIHVGLWKRRLDPKRRYEGAPFGLEGVESLPV